MEQCGMANKPYRETELTLKNILSKHDTLDANRLSREGFLSYYREVAATDPRQVHAQKKSAERGVETKYFVQR